MTFGPGWEVVLAARAGNYKERQVAQVSVDRRADGASKEVKFVVEARSLDGHTHGEIERGDKQAIMAALSRCADEIVAVLRRTPPKPS